MINLVEKYGAEKWSFISSHFPERIGKQCRERWFNHLCPTVNKTAWSKEEEWILFIMHNQIGNKWSQLCKYLPGRTDNTIKNHWNSTMKKRIDQLQAEYDNMIKDKTPEEIKKIQDDILQKCKVMVEEENKKFFDEKMKNYEKFKNSTVDNKQNMYKLKKILLFRTHSKKIKRRGRKKKYLTNEEKSTSSIKNYIQNTSNSMNYRPKKITKFKLSSKKEKEKEKEKKEIKTKKKFGTPKYKKNKTKRIIGEPYIDENKEYPKKINLITSPVRKFIISKNEFNESLKKDKNPKNKSSKNNSNNNININNSINIINNITNDNSILINNYNSGNAEPPASYNNNFIIYKNQNNINTSLYNGTNPFESQNNNKIKKRIKFESGEKNYQFISNMKDISPSTPLKLKGIETPNFNINETNKLFIKTDKIFNESNYILEKSAFNKQIMNEMAFPYSNIKTHLNFTSSIKKPVKIISEETAPNNNNNINLINNNISNEQKFYLNNNNNMSNNRINSGKKFFQNIENITPNKIMDFTENNGTGTIPIMKLNNIEYSSNKKHECLNSGVNLNINNNPYQVFSPTKNLTPFNISNANLDKMFFSNFN